MIRPLRPLVVCRITLLMCAGTSWDMLSSVHDNDSSLIHVYDKIRVTSCEEVKQKETTLHLMLVNLSLRKM